MTAGDWKRILRKRQGYEDNSTWVAVWVDDIQEIWNDGFEAGKQAAISESTNQNENTKTENSRVSRQA